MAFGLSFIQSLPQCNQHFHVLLDSDWIHRQTSLQYFFLFSGMHTRKIQN
jgi:hypothetical protein